MSVITTVILFIAIRIIERKWVRHLSLIHTVSFGTMLKFNGGNNGHGLKNVTRKET